MSEDRQCSDLFKRVFDSHTGGGCTRTCACGRVYFDISDNYWSWEEGELEDLKEKEVKNPDRYIGTNGTVMCMEVGGMEIVEDCKCDLARKFESFIREDAVNIKKYLQEWAKGLREKADKVDIEE